MNTLQPNDQSLATRPFIIPIFIPHMGCPNRCAFCNQNTISQTPAREIKPDDIIRQISRFLEYKGKKRKDVEIAFFGGNFLSLPQDFMKECLDIASGFVEKGVARGIRFSTRPDSIDEKSLRFIRDYPVCAIEIGAQSMDDKVLALSQRGHKASDTVAAVLELKKRGYKTGIQLMTGLPGESYTSFISSVRDIMRLEPDFIRLYPTLVVEKSLLARWFTAGYYRPLPLKEAVSRGAFLLSECITRNIRIIRMGLQIDSETKKSIIAGPWHPSFGDLVIGEYLFQRIVLLIADRVGICRNKDSDPSRLQDKQNEFLFGTVSPNTYGHHNAGGPFCAKRFHVEILVSPKRIASLKGKANKNIERLACFFPRITWALKADPSVGEFDARIEDSAPVIPAAQTAEGRKPLLRPS